MKKSIFKNYLYNVSLTILNIIFPIITFPYISRVLGAAGVGKVNFATSIVNYFLLLASLGIPVYGIREISKVRDNRKDASKVYSEIYSINLLSTILFSTIYYSMILLVPYFKEQRLLFVVMGLLVILNLFNIDWLYQGFEDYKYITIRSLVFKLASIVAMFLLVKGRSDYVIYAAITVIALGGANIVNIFRAKRYVNFTIKGINLKRHYKQVLIIFFMGVAINVYNNLDSTMLGFISGDESVGYYSAATKINRMVINVVTSLGVVLLPRLSYYIESKEIEEFNKIIKKSINFIFFIGLPACTGLYLLAPSIIRIFSGEEFIPAITTMRINIPVILFVAIANITSVQILLPLKREKEVAIAVSFAAVLNFCMNFVMIHTMKENGAALASTLAEFIGMSIQIFYCRSYISKDIFTLDKFKYILGSILIIAIVTIVKIFVMNDFILIIISIIMGGIGYFILMLLLKDEFISMILKKINIIGK